MKLESLDKTFKQKKKGKKSINLIKSVEKKKPYKLRT